MLQDECDATTSTCALPMSGYSPTRNKHGASTKSNSCGVKIPNEFLTANSAGCRVDSNPSHRPIYDVFLGGSCGDTVWRRDLVIPYLEKHAITYYDPQRSVWNEHMINEESVAKEVALNS
ncbi:unnamed protein product [Gongylonema pulchrum]|uniref:Methyltranfer_dom domain-containing protein n=1 Tax=Gongylonema pulchrum TaxID=637853 RepID=A0A183EJP2_9BILA|nr:unnamed protein product [Gongylonema pulchrum]